MALKQLSNEQMDSRTEESRVMVYLVPFAFHMRKIKIISWERDTSSISARAMDYKTLELQTAYWRQSEHKNQS